MSQRIKRAVSLTPEQKLARKRRALMRFKGVVRLVIANLYWMQELDEMRIGDNVMKNIQLLTRKKLKKSSLTIQEKAILSKPKEDRTEEEKQLLGKVIGGLKCFRRYPPNVKSQLAAVTYFIYIGPGRHIVKQDHAPLAMYFILSGEAGVTVRHYDKLFKEWVDRDSGTIGPGTMFGEVALIHGIVRLATITTITPCELLMIKKEDFDLVLKATVLKAWEEIQKIMNVFSYFKNCDVVTKRECSIVSRTKVYQPDETILGDDCGLTNFVHFIAKGSCCIIEHLILNVTKINGVKHYKLHNSEKKPVDESKNSIFETDTSRVKITKSKLSRNRLTGVSMSSVSPTRAGRSSTKRQFSTQAPLFKSRSSRIRPQDSKIQPSFGTLLRAQLSRGKSSVPRISEMSSGHKQQSSRILGDVSYLMAKKSTLTSFKDRQYSSVIQGEDPNVETHFIKVCDLSQGACFNIGENFKRRRVVAKTTVFCLLIPRDWIFKNNKDNIWNRVQQFLNNHIPTTEQLYKHFVEEKKFLRYRKSLVADILSQKKISTKNSIHNVPYSIRLEQGTDDYLNDDNDIRY